MTRVYDQHTYAAEILHAMRRWEARLKWIVEGNASAARHQAIAAHEDQRELELQQMAGNVLPFRKTA